MLKTLSLLWIVAGCLLSVLYIFCGVSSFVSPESFPYSIFLSLGYPFALLAQVLLILVTLFISKKWALVYLTVLLTGIVSLRNTFAFHPFNPSFHTAKQQSVLRIMTWNVREFNCLHPQGPDCSSAEAIAGIVKAYWPDVICFQEYSNTVNGNPDMTAILNRAGYRYSAFADLNTGSQIGTVIFSRLPILKHDTLLMNRQSWEHVLRCDVSFEGKPVSIFTTHLQSFSLYSDTTQTHSVLGQYKIAYQRKRIFYHKLKDIEIAHVEEAKLIRRFMSQTTNPVIFCADINATPASYTYGKLKDHLQDVYLEAGFALGATYYSLVPTLRIDICLADQKFQVKQATVKRVYLSDHFPVIADLQWK